MRRIRECFWIFPVAIRLLVRRVRQCIRVICAIVEVPFASRKKSKGSFADASFVVAFKLCVRLTRVLRSRNFERMHVRGVEVRRRCRGPKCIMFSRAERAFWSSRCTRMRAPGVDRGQSVRVRTREGKRIYVYIHMYVRVCVIYVSLKRDTDEEGEGEGEPQAASAIHLKNCVKRPSTSARYRQSDWIGWNSVSP